MNTAQVFGSYFVSFAALNRPAKLMILEEHMNRRYTSNFRADSYLVISEKKGLHWLPNLPALERVKDLSI